MTATRRDSLSATAESTLGALLPGIGEHPLRRTVAAELHARPFIALQSPVRVSHLAMVSDVAEADWAHVAALCRRFGVDPPSPDAPFFYRDFGPFRLRWERHSEFSTYTVFVAGPGPAPFEDPALRALPGDWLCRLPGQLLVGTHLLLEDRGVPPRSVAEVERLYGTDTLACSEVAEGAALVWSDFRLHKDGFGRMLVQDRSLAPRRAGRLVQRLLEIETYRMMALLAFPLARELAPEITRNERVIERLTQRMTSAQDRDGDHALLQELSDVAAEVERLSARASFRLSAARAYNTLVIKRIENLRERRIGDLQTIGKFMERRLAPAMRTCESVAERLEGLSRRVSRAGNLLRTRVDVALEAQNRDLLASMNRRAKMQLHLQQTVEGLSVVVLSYYAMGLLGYALQALTALGVPLPPTLDKGLALPFVVGGLWLAMLWQRRRLYGAGTA